MKNKAFIEGQIHRLQLQKELILEDISDWSNDKIKNYDLDKAFKKLLLLSSQIKTLKWVLD